MSFDDTTNYSVDFRVRYEQAIKALLSDRLADAATMFQSLHKDFPESASVSMFLGRTLYQLDALDDAIYHIELALAKFPNDADLLRSRGRMSLAKYTKEAERYFQQALTNDSTDKSAVELIELYMADDELSKAREVWKLAVGRYGLTESLNEYKNRLAE